MANETTANAARHYKLTGQPQKAINAANQTLLYFMSGKIKDDKNNSQAQTLNLIGDCYQELGEYGKALDSYTKAFNFIKKGMASATFFAESDNYVGIGNTYNSLGNAQKALQYYEKALPDLIRYGDGNKEVRLLSAIGDLYTKLSNTPKAIENYEQALKFSQIRNETFDNHNYIDADILSRIARVKLQTGKMKEVLELLKEAEQLNCNEARKNALISQTYGDVYARLKDNAKAVDYYHQALGVYRGEQNRSGEAAVLSELATVSQSAGNSRLAIFYGKQSINKYQELRQNIESLDKDTQKTYLKSVEDVYKKLADILAGEGRFPEAQNVLMLLKEEEYFGYVRRDASEIKNLTARTDITLNDDERKVIERYNLIAGRVAQIGAEFQKLDDKKRKLGENVLLPLNEQKQYEELSTQLFDANAAFKLFLEKELVAELAKTGKAGKKEQIDNDRNLILKLRGWGAGTVLLTTIAGDENYRVILTTPKAQTDGKYTIPIAELNKKVFAFRDALQNPSVDPRPLGKELYDILIKPVEKDLEAANAKTLIWSLDGTLRYIPLAALSPDGKSYLVEKYQTAVITSTARQDLLDDKKPEWRTLGVGVSNAEIVADPTEKENKISFAALPNVKLELAAIVRDEQAKEETGITNGKKFVDAEFNVKNFSESLTKETEDGKRKYTVVHVASHFRLGKDTASSFLLLGGGKTLTLEQISNSAEMTFENVELVTLSACNTAFGSDATAKKSIRWRLLLCRAEQNR